MRFTVECCCLRNHKDLLFFEAETREEIEIICGFLDGSSPVYAIQPGPDSPIGKCASCGLVFKATIIGPV